MSEPKLTTIAACKVANLNRDRFNEHVAAGHFTCAPETVAGRTRLFTLADMVSMKLFSQLLDDKYSPESAGRIACKVGAAAKENPDAPAIAYCEAYMGPAWALLDTDPCLQGDWTKQLLSGCDIKRITHFNVAKLRRMIEHEVNELQSIIGPED